MTPQEAIKLLDDAVATITANRNTHIKMQEAVQLLTAAIEPVVKGKK